MKNKLIWLILIAVVLSLVAWYFGSMQSAQLLWNLSRRGTVIWPLILASAIVNSIHPCAFSILLVTIAFLLSTGQLRTNILKMGGMYIFGIFLAYILIGIGVLQAFHLFNTPDFMAKLGASILVSLGAINLINEFFPQFPIKPRIPHAIHQKMAVLMKNISLPASFFLGSLVGICAFPCSGGPYVMILGLLHDKVTYLKGFMYLMIYNLIFVLPLIVMLLIASDTNLLSKVQEWQKKEIGPMKFWGGIAMIILGIIIFLI